MDDFVESMIKTIHKKWDKLSPQKKDKIREELVNTFITFVGEGKQREKKVIGIHLK